MGDFYKSRQQGQFWKVFMFPAALKTSVVNLCPVTNHFPELYTNQSVKEVINYMRLIK